MGGSSSGQRVGLGVRAPSAEPRSPHPVVVLLIPVFNEAASLQGFLEACDAVFTGAAASIRFLFVDDGSQDGTGAALDALAASRSDMTVIHLSRNFGKEAALSAGLDYADGDAVVPIDVDLQDPPGVVIQFIEQWRAGYDVVLGRRTDRSADSRFKRWTSQAFYRVVNAISDTPLPAGVGDFRLMDRRVIEVIKQVPERSRFMKGLFAWVGFRTAYVDYTRERRVAGTTSWGPWGLWNFALDGITSFSTFPLRIWTYLGAVIAAACIAFSALVVGLQVTGNVGISGYASLIVGVLFVGSVQLISLGLLGEYLARVTAETKHRPVYVIDQIHGESPTEAWLMDLKEEDILGDSVGEHWYYRSKFRALETLLRPHLATATVLDVGAGSGFFARELISSGFSAEVTCVDVGYAEDRDEVLEGGVIHFRREVTSSTADLALFLDVLEHVDDDRGMLEHYRRALGPGRFVAITVPAFQFLWSGHDEFLEHRRRYTLRGLEALVRESGLVVVQGNYFYGSVFPAAAIVRLGSRRPGSYKSSLRQYGSTANRLLTQICGAETRVQRHNRAVGLSVMVLAITR